MNMISFFEMQIENAGSVAREKGFNFDDPRIMFGAWRNEPNPDACKVGFFILQHLFSGNKLIPQYSAEL